MKLFIDANIYLRFYDSNSRQFKKLLAALPELKAYIFVTAQIANEVRRNKLRVAIASFTEYSKKLGMQKTTLPEHFDGLDSNKMKKWNRQRNELVTVEKSLASDFAEIAEETIDAIMKSSDKVSVILEDLFEHSAIATEAEVLSAMRRKQLGNPPGKAEDPLGDQISWEQLVSAHDGKEKIWLISNDYDYLDKYGGKCYLNAFLYHELASKSNTPPVIYCFTSLADGLMHFSKNSGYKVKELPSQKVMEEITVEESLVMRDFVASSNLVSVGYDPLTMTLEVEFHNGSIYQYMNVLPEIYKGLVKASSVGAFFHDHIKKGGYPYIKLS
jgi:hypothetical protein